MKMARERGITRRHVPQDFLALQSTGMGRLCERPGCSEPAAVAYGMRAEDLVFWLDVLSNVEDVSAGGLCLRHADAMVVPRNWTLDDHRDPDLHLFRPPSEAVDRRRGTRRTARPAEGGEQLELGVEPPSPESSDTEESASNGPSVTDDVEIPTDDVDAPMAIGDADADDVDNWTPAFDDADDLDGLLSARSPLLARAFRGDDRPKG